VRNLRITLAYDGTEFAGWQVQPGRTTVQGTLASAIGRLSGENVLPQASGRTDAGVHALGQVVSFATTSPIPEENWMRALNDILPASIRVLDVIAAASAFHARKSARAKTYRYRILRSDVCSPFLARYVWHYPYPLNEKAMTAAAGLVVGQHDFTSFAAVDPERIERRLAADKQSADNSTTTSSTDLITDSITDAITNVRTIFSSAWLREDEEFVYTVRGSGFLHHMVRNLVGTFLLVGKGTLCQDEIRRIIDARIRASAGPTAPASGLFLVDVEY
jgi:tRNA pseudouridine38-40 synthase